MDARLRIAAGRKARELDPATDALRQCVEMCQDDKTVDPVVQLRLREMPTSWMHQLMVRPDDCTCLDRRLRRS